MSLSLTALGVKDRYVPFSALNLPTCQGCQDWTQVLRADLEPWSPMGTGQLLARVRASAGRKDFLLLGMPTPVPSGPATQAQGLSFVAALP